jgi:DNA repair protein RadA/Sms
VPNGEERLKEAATHGFLKAVVPRANAPKKSRMGEMEIIGVDRLSDALDAIV